MAITKQQLASSPSPAGKSIAPFTTGFAEDPTSGKPHILTNYKAYQPCCCGSTRHFCRRFQLQKSCSGSWEHFQGYPMLSRGENSIQEELQSNYTWHSIWAQGSSTGRQNSHRSYFYGWVGEVAWFFPQFSVSLHLTMRYTSYSSHLHPVICIHTAFGWEKELEKQYISVCFKNNYSKGKGPFYFTTPLNKNPQA